MQRLKTGPLVEAAGAAELWLDGGHNAAAGLAIADLLKSLPARETHLICGMLNTKDVSGYLSPISAEVKSLTAVSIPGEENTLPAEATARAASQVGMQTQIAETVDAALAEILRNAPDSRVLICGSLYLAGAVLRTNG
jgi:dihydrofolate synthase/folylpolyglutamate synthase